MTIECQTPRAGRFSSLEFRCAALARHARKSLAYGGANVLDASVAVSLAHRQDLHFSPMADQLHISFAIAAQYGCESNEFGHYKRRLQSCIR